MRSINRYVKILCARQCLEMIACGSIMFSINTFGVYCLESIEGDEFIFSKLSKQQIPEVLALNFLNTHSID